MKKILIMACAAGMLTLLPACGGQKTSDAASKQDTVQTATNSNAPYADPSQENSYNAKLGGKDFVITIKRAADKSLPTVTDDLGKSFYDNRVEVTITCNGQPFFSKSYTKEAFASFLTTKSETQGTICLAWHTTVPKVTGMPYALEHKLARWALKRARPSVSKSPSMAVPQALCAIPTKTLRAMMA